MSILVRREQEKYFFRLKTAVNHGTVKRQAGAEVSRFEVSSSSETQGRLVGVRGNKSGKEMKRRMFM